MANLQFAKDDSLQIAVGWPSSGGGGFGCKAAQTAVSTRSTGLQFSPDSCTVWEKG